MKLNWLLLAPTLLVAILQGPLLADKIYLTYKNGVASFTNEPLNTRSKVVISHETPSAGYRQVTAVPYSREISQIAASNGVEPALAASVIKAESNFNPTAVSKKGAQGLMQLMPFVSKRLGVKDPYNIVENISAGVKHLKALLHLNNGDKKLALAAYNAGQGAVDKYNGIPPYSETRNYIASVLGYYKNIQKSLETHDHFSMVEGTAKPDAELEKQVAEVVDQIYSYVGKNGEKVFTNQDPQLLAALYD
jgi:hypothetical protein